MQSGFEYYYCIRMFEYLNIRLQPSAPTGVAGSSANFWYPLPNGCKMARNAFYELFLSPKQYVISPTSC